MGLYNVACPSCGDSHLWFSGNEDQRCPFCREMKEIDIRPRPYTRIFVAKNKERFKFRGHHGYVLLTLNAGYWNIYEKEREFVADTLWKKVVKKLGIYNKKYFIRAERVR